jgi:predicted peptidase
MNPTLLPRRTFLASPLLLSACAPMFAPMPAAAPVTTAERLRLPDGQPPIRAWVSLPRGYDERAAITWPLLVFLHGSGECGDDLQKVRFHGPPKHAAAGREYPFILCSPQLETDDRWPPDRLHALLAALRARWRIDAARITATGLSLGGHGVWDWAAAFPSDLAAIAPVCGHGTPAAVCRARQVPVRAYHGDADTVVPLADQKACVDALRACGGQADFIVYPGVGHGAWEPAYEDPVLVSWLMQQARR